MNGLIDSYRVVEGRRRVSARTRSPWTIGTSHSVGYNATLGTAMQSVYAYADQYTSTQRGASSFTVSLWVANRVAAAQDGARVLSWNNSPSNYQNTFVIDVTTGNIVQAWSYGTGDYLVAPGACIAPAALTTSEQLIVVTVTSTTMSMYVNGIFVDSAALASSLTIPAGGVLALAGNYRDGSMPCTLDMGDVSVWNRVLTSAEIWMLYAPATRFTMSAPVTRRTYFDMAPTGGGSTFVPQVIMVL